MSKKEIIKVFVLLWAGLFAACSNTNSMKETWISVDDPIVLETELEFAQLSNYAEIDSMLSNIVSSSDHLEMEVLATVIHGDFSAPINAVTFTPTEPISKRVFIAGGIHGNEYVTTAAVLELISDLAADSSLYSGTYFEIIPVVNPWGLAHGTRQNANQRDLNRDFAEFTELESRAVRDYIEGKQYDLVLNHHGMWGRDFMVFRFWGGQWGTAENAIEALINNGFSIDRTAVGDRDGIIEIPDTDSVPSMDRYMRWNNSDNVYVPETYSWDYEQSTLDNGIVIQRIVQDIFIRRLY